MSDGKEIQRTDGLAVEEAKPKLKRPQLFRVIPVSYTHLTLPTNREV